MCSTLSSLTHANKTCTEELQLEVHDYSTNIFLKPLLEALANSSHAGTWEYHALSTWNVNMHANSAAAIIYK